MGYSIRKIHPADPGRNQQGLWSGPVYNEDGLQSVHNHDFLRDPSFCRAYWRGVAAAGDDYQWHWRVHVGLWAAYSASKLAGDFVECGVNRGFLASAIMEYLDWDSLNKIFYLLDTFMGLDENHVSDEERVHGKMEANQQMLKSCFYTTDLDSVKANFAQWKNIRIIVGSIPDTLDAVMADKVAYLHLDMNCAPPEVAAFDYFWERLVPGAFILLDDYAYWTFERQKTAMDRAAAERNLKIVSLPTGQGLLLKPA
ncbi:MAG: TylF/MycF/NovP-related O-methyltransferase [Acidobacteriota bacterium]